MKKIKTALIAVTSASFIALSMLPASAENMTLITDSEAKQIAEAVKADEFASLTVKKFNTADAYRVYRLDYDIIEGYRKSRNFKSLITDKEFILLPAVNNRDSFFKECDGALITFSKENGVYKWKGQSNGGNILNFNALTDELLKSIGKEPVNVIHTYSDEYYMDIIYIETAENEYAVPYFQYSYPDVVRWLSSGKVYTVPEFMERIEHAFNDDYNYMSLKAENGIILDGSRYLTDDMKLALGILEKCSDDETWPETREADNFSSVMRMYSVPVRTAFSEYDNIRDILESDLMLETYYIVEHKDGSRSYFGSDFKEIKPDGNSANGGENAQLPPVNISEKAFAFFSDPALIESYLPADTKIRNVYYLSGEACNMGTAIYYDTYNGSYVYYCYSATGETVLTAEKFCEYQKKVSEEAAKTADPKNSVTDISLYSADLRAQKSEQLTGDINGNGKIDIYDAIEIAKSLTGTRTFTEEEIKIADMNADGKADLYDVIKIAELLAQNADIND